MAKRSYGELCPVARALDVIGERWTILIVRELMLGPKRFKDLLARLPAMGTNRLAERLRGLYDAGILAKRTLPAPAEVQVYELTELGERLRPLINCLSIWGSELPLPADADPAGARPDLIALGLAALAAPELTADVDETWELRVAGESFHVKATHGTVAVRSGPAPLPAELVVECDLATFLDLIAGRTTPVRAAREQRASFIGPTATRTRAFRVLSRAQGSRELRPVAA